VSECEEVVVLQEQGNNELSEKKLLQYHRYKIEEYKWWHKNWVLFFYVHVTVHHNKLHYNKTK
jgi:hypothetical protein